MAYKKGSSDVFLKFVAQASKLKQIKEICTKNLYPSKEEISQLLQKEFKLIIDIVEDKNEKK